MIKKSDNKGQSKYALKVKRRRAICQKLGIPTMPFPCIWAIVGHKFTGQK